MTEPELIAEIQRLKPGAVVYVGRNYVRVDGVTYEGASAEEILRNVRGE